jgi:hypothetical protein
MLSASTQGPISPLVLMIELTGQARLFALPMLVAIAGATVTARSIAMRSVCEARLGDADVARRLQAQRAAFVSRPGEFSLPMHMGAPGPFRSAEPRARRGR